MEKILTAYRYFIFLIKSLTISNKKHLPKTLKDDVFENEKNYYAFADINKLRNKLINSEKKIEIKDFGAGSKINASKTRGISDIAKNSAKKSKYGKLLFNLVKTFEPNNILEFGTSLGISTLYLSKANNDSKVITMEGCPETAKVAKRNFEILKSNNIEIVVGDFSKTLNETLTNIPFTDLVFFDGNHSKEPTLDYFNKCIEKSNDKSIFIFDDIHWSKGMLEAWNTIKKHPSVTLTIDTFFVGIVFFDKDYPKKDIYLKY